MRALRPAARSCWSAVRPPPRRWGARRRWSRCGSWSSAGARPRPAATAVAGLTGLAANELYRELTGGEQ